MKIVHIISGLRIGGAETMLLRLISASRRRDIVHEVVSLTVIGRIGKKIEALGIPVRMLELDGPRDSAVRIARLALWLRKSSPDVVQTWLYHADLIGGLAARAATRAPILWNLRHSEFPERNGRPAAPWTALACARLSRLVPRRIICCSEASRRAHTRLGYAAERMVMIPNGFDLSQFRPDPGARSKVRRELGIADDDLLIGVVGRNRPEKDHQTFLDAIGRLRAEMPRARFLICGPEVGWERPELAGPIRRAGLEDSVMLLGWRDDMPHLDAALDVACSSSASEGFPNTVAEAMACGTPCVATDVGDSARIVGDTGRIVPPGDSRAFASAVRSLAALGEAGRRDLGRRARLRIGRLYNLPGIVERYENLYDEVAAGSPPAGRAARTPRSVREPRSPSRRSPAAP